VSTRYTLLNQVETVTVQINDANGNPVTSGLVSITDVGQTQVVGISDGTATAVFTFQLFAEQPFAHQVSALYNGSTVSFTAPATLSQYFFQILFDLALFDALVHGG
jgi:hypothetical protein